MLLGTTPLAAQENTSSAAPPDGPAPVENIGPRELSDFNLTGRVTRSAEPVAQPAPPSREPAPRAAPPAAALTERTAPARSAATTAPRATASVQRAAIDPIAQRPVPRRPAGTTAAAAAAAAPALASPMPATPLEAAGGFSPLPWIAALLLLGGIAAVYFGRRQRQGRYAGAGVSEFAGVEEQRASPPPVRAPAPSPRPQAKARPPQPAAAEPLVRRPPPPAAPAAAPTGVVTSSLRAVKPAGVVSTSLRPWIELELEPSQAMVTDEHAAIAFDVTLFNSGSAPARDVAVEACLINAGQQQDVQLNEFYTSPGEVRDKIPSVAPMSRITLKSAVRLPRAAVQEYEVEGRKLFMPMVAVNSRYRWSSGEGQSAASFLVGSAANDSAKLAPLRLDRGRRGWKGLSARRYEKGIRR